MFHDRHAPRASASSHVHPGLWPAFEAAHAWCDVGVEQARLSTKLCDDTRLLLLRATADRNAEELGRTVSDFVEFDDPGPEPDRGGGLPHLAQLSSRRGPRRVARRPVALRAAKAAL